ncbi:hypothetical protein GUJ93_ZPchr0013g37491 [Zizania palustris]|uniref:Uncharacterized protein n=1 Tax=Zizania palustris TaxID=103762 RepID=A0A8J5X426_ZIZPA|nr:hypothetical protein GUJ93_ZPchr0013g37491 [Zizania palustris]
MRRTDRLRDLIDFYNAMAPIAKNGVLLYNGRQIILSVTPLYLRYWTPAGEGRRVGRFLQGLQLAQQGSFLLDL